MAWSDAGQRPEAMPVACTGCDFAVSNRPAVSTPATATYRCRSQSITASGMIYDHVSFKPLREISGAGDPGPGHGPHLGVCGHLEPWAGYLLRFWGLCHGHVS